jgi:hypothetical protein
MKYKKMIYHHNYPVGIVGGKWVYKTNEFEVEVMAIVDNYAMVRRKRCMPFVVNVKDLSEPESAAQK